MPMYCMAEARDNVQRVLGWTASNRNREIWFLYEFLESVPILFYFLHFNINLILKYKYNIIKRDFIRNILMEKASRTGLMIGA